MTDNHYLFTGQERDPESGLDHFWFRKHTSSLGRWLSPDPIAYVPGNPQELNKYAYVANNPLRYVDLLGLVLAEITIDGKKYFAVASQSEDTGG